MERRLNTQYDRYAVTGSEHLSGCGFGKDNVRVWHLRDRRIYKSRDQ